MEKEWALALVLVLLTSIPVPFGFLISNCRNLKNMTELKPKAEMRGVIKFYKMRGAQHF